MFTMVMSRIVMVNHSTAASCGDFPVSIHLISSFSNVTRLWCLLLVWPASVKPGNFKMVLFSLWISWQYHIGLGGGGKVFQDVELWEREALNIELKHHEVLTFGIGYPL